ncbi:hypothetical protein GCM10022408_11800 [Hymenobacter fastidiosus]|uniref:YtxH domain-containing protein n=1 Tax=Hymenobacter fastidiosus TaxID=486264 RepID=A0ABP7RTS2_9BACT
MENKPNQPTSGASSSQSTGPNKTSSASNPQAGSTAQPSQTDRTKSPSSASANPQAATDTSADSATRTSGSTQRNPDQSQDRTAQGSKDASGNQLQSWMNVSSWLDGANQIPQSVKELGTKATDQFNKLSPTQKVIGGALLVSGLSWLALRSKNQPKSSKPEYRAKTDYRSSRPYGAGVTSDQQFQGPYGDAPTRGISDSSARSSADSRNASSDPGSRSGSSRTDSAGISGYGEDDYSGSL